MDIIFVTGNENKLREAREILKNFNIKGHSIELIERQGTAEEIVDAKLNEAYKKLKKPLIVEDTSLVFESMGQLPGPYIKDFLRNISIDDFHKLAAFKGDCKARALCLVGFMDSNGNKTLFKGECYGNIVKPKGTSNFGWDPVFKPKGGEKTFAEMTAEEKNKVSHRKAAFKKLRCALEKIQNI
ncbi:MAG: RdgB/HAM1 family non-canonical purine NTP pyrophosphatase [Nanoarchaeota archaeon]